MKNAEEYPRVASSLGRLRNCNCPFCAQVMIASSGGGHIPCNTAIHAADVRGITPYISGTRAPRFANSARKGVVPSAGSYMDVEPARADSSMMMITFLGGSV